MRGALMRARRETRGSFAVNIAVIALFAAFLGIALFKLLQIERQMRIEAGENMLWVLSQSQREVLRFDAAIGHFANGLATPDDVTLRYDLLLSRLNLLQDEPQRGKLEQLGFAQDLHTLGERLFALEPAVQRYVSGDILEAQGITEAVAPLDRLLFKAANAAMYAEWDELGSRLDQARAATWQIVGYVIVIMLAGALLSSRLLLTLQRSRKAEGFLRREKQFSELVVSSSNEGIVAIDDTGRCTLWNPAMEKIIPVRADRALGRRLSDIAGIFATGAVQQTVFSSLQGNLHEHTDQPFFRDGTDAPRYLDLLCSPLLDDKAVVGVLIFVRDVTERRAAARALARNRDELEQLVAERTADLQQAKQKLLSALEELERSLDNERSATEFYRGFASTVSHQFRTPLAVIDSSAQRLIRRRHKLDPDEVSERASRIRASISRLTRFIEATLDAARLDTGQIEVKAMPHNLAGLARTACARQKELTPRREIIVTSEQDHDETMLALCDPTLTEHIFANLLSNAIKYSAPDTPVRIHLQRSGNAVECRFSDHGVGIPAHELPRLFERFFRASTADDVPGTGIGLNLSRELARRQGGEIIVASTAGRGSTFTVTLPHAGTKERPDTPHNQQEETTA